MRKILGDCKLYDISHYCFYHRNHIKKDKDGCEKCPFKPKDDHPCELPRIFQKKLYTKIWIPK